MRSTGICPQFLFVRIVFSKSCLRLSAEKSCRLLHGKRQSIEPKIDRLRIMKKFRHEIRVALRTVCFQNQGDTMDKVVHFEIPFDDKDRALFESINLLCFIMIVLIIDAQLTHNIYKVP